MLHPHQITSMPGIVSSPPVDLEISEKVIPTTYHDNAFKYILKKQNIKYNH